MSTISVTGSQTETATSGVVIDVVSGGTLVQGTIGTSGSAIIQVGGTDSGTTISGGGTELVLGLANADMVAGSQTISVGSSGGGTITNETILSGGVAYLSVKGTSATATTVDSAGQLLINGNISANDTVISGGTVNLESAKATLTGTLVFSGGGEIAVTGNTSAGYGDQAVISGFTSGDVIDITSGTTVGAAGTAATSSIATSGGNTVITVSGGGATQSFTFSGTAIGADLILLGDGSGGVEIAYNGGGAVTSVGPGPTQSGIIVNSGAPLTVYAGGSIADATILPGASATILSGGTDSGSTIESGGSETVIGSATADTVYGSQTVSDGPGAVSSETVSGGTVTLSGGTASAITLDSGGTLAVASGGIASATVIDGGTVQVLAPSATLADTLDFGLNGTLDIDAIAAAGDGVSALISGFYTTDVISLTAFGAGTQLSTTQAGGDTIATVTSGGASETLTFSGSIAANLTLSATATTSGTAEDLTYTPTTVPTTTEYTPGDLVLSIYGDGADTGTYSLDQAAPIVLQEITTTGSVVSQLVLPQQTYTLNGVTEYAISGEYQSASEGLLTLAENGQSLTIMGYGVTATAFDASSGATTYGTSALGQSTSLSNAAVVPVPRVVADIGYNATIDTSTELYNVFNTNNPRSVVTVNGTTFYVSGQGNGADGTEGVFLTDDGSTEATPIYNTLTDTRDIEIANGQLYVSIDSKQNNGGGLYDFGSTLPTSATAPTEVPGIGASVAITAGTSNGINSAGDIVNLSPEQYFFATPTTLYIADGGDPKEGGLGDGGLQKWSLIDGTWELDYTLAQGLNLIPDTEASGTTGLIGLAGTVEGNNVVLYATNETVAETDQTYLYGITDQLSATTLPTSESFTLLETAAPDTLIRGVAFAPTSTSTLPEVTSTLTVSSAVTSTGLTIAAGGEIIVLAGGTISAIDVLAGGSAVVSSGGQDSGTVIANGGSELMLGSATGDFVDGTQTLSNATAVVTSETVGNGGALDLFLAGVSAISTTVLSGGSIDINGRGYAIDTVVSGGTVIVASPKATLSGTFDFTGSGGTLETSAIASAGYGDQAVISGFAAGDTIDVRDLAPGAALTVVSSGGNTVATFTSGSSAEKFILSGTTYLSGLTSGNDGSGGVEITYTPPPPTTLIISSGQTSTFSAGVSTTIEVLSSGTLSNGVIASGGSAIISVGGVDTGTTILAGGSETVSGAATGDQVYGLQDVTTGPNGGASAATIANETVFNGGTIELFLKPDTALDVTVSSGGQFLLNGNVSATNTVLEGGGLVELQSPKATLSGSFAFNGSATLEFTANTSAGFGDNAINQGFTTGDFIDETTIATGTLSVTSSGGNTVAVISGGTFPQSFTFAGTDIASHLKLVSDGGTGVELEYAACFARGTRLMTARGPVAVEHLAIGDLLPTLLPPPDAAGAGAQPILWIGRRDIDLEAHPDRSLVQPIRIRAGAIAEGRPERDLLVSPDHALFIDGALVAARLLVNGGSIVVERARRRVTYFHVELPRHAVVLAEGMPAETYRDTGNRAMFANAATAAPRPAGVACAPLLWDPAATETLWRRLAERSARLGWPLPAPAASVADPDLHLLLGSRRVKPVVAEAARYVFALPPDAPAAWLVSRTARPSDARPWLDDRRRIGVRVRRLTLASGAQRRDVALDDPSLDQGWWATEWDRAAPSRWTAGRARLPQLAGARLLEVELAGAMRYEDATHGT